MLYILLTWFLAPLWWPIALARHISSLKPKRILIAEIAGIGDIVCSASLFQNLRHQYPEAIIDLLVDPIAKGLAPLIPMVDQVRPFAYAEQKGLKGRLKLAWIAAKYDTAICLIPSAAQLTAFCWGAVPHRLTVLPEKGSASYRFLAPLMTRVARHPDGDFFLATQFELCKSLLSGRLMQQKALPFCKQETPLLPADRDWVGFLVSSGRALKRLSEAQMVAIIEELLKNTEWKRGIVLFGGRGDVTQATKILAKLARAGVSENVVNTVGQYELAELPALLRQLKLFIGVDSGVTHMADAFNVPIVCIAGPVNLHEVYLTGENRLLLESELDCHPCSTVFSTPNSCAREDRACLEQLKTKQIIIGVEMLLEKGAKRHVQ